MKKTKIVCTIGPKTESEEMLAKMLDAGMNVMRLNFSHGDYAEHGQRIQNLRNVMSKTGKTAAILLDTKGPEIRTMKLEGGNDVSLKAGQTFTFTTDKSVIGNSEMVAVTYEGFTTDLSVGNTVLVDDGLIGMEVTAIEGNKVICKVLNNGDLGENKGVNLPGVSIALPALAEKDKQDLIFGCEQGVDFVAASFIRKRSDVIEIREHLKAHGGENIHIISKIENQEGLNNFDEILKVSDGIMVARGDLGVEVDMEEVPVLQKQFIHKCNVAAKPVITATQMLDSMIRNPRPTRAEASDVANAIIDGTDAIMLSGETAAGKYPIEAVGTMVRIATYIEAHQLHDNTQLLQQEAVRNATVRTVANAVSYSCCQMARDLNANAIITPSNSGTTARMVARFRPDCPIIAPTPSEHAYNQLGLSYGVVPAHMGMSGDTDELINTAVEAAQQSGLVKTGDVVIISAGVPTGVSGTTNLIKAHIVGNVLLRGEGVGSGCASGNVCTVNTLSDLESDFKDGNVIVTKMTTSEMLPYMRRASAVVVESTNPECHAAVACQAMGIPMMMDRSYQAVHMLKSGMMITVDANEGFIYNGIKA